MIDPQSPQYIAQQKFLQTQSDVFLTHSQQRSTINILWIGCSSTNLDDEIRRSPSSHKILQQCLNKAKIINPDIEVLTKTHILEDLNFDHCEGNYSMQWHYCTRPCRISQRKAEKVLQIHSRNSIKIWSIGQISLLLLRLSGGEMRVASTTNSSKDSTVLKTKRKYME